MNIALINTDPKGKFYNIGLLKIGSMLKAKGHSCAYYHKNLPVKKYDQAYVSTLFTFDILRSLGICKHVEQFVTKNIKVGGIAASLMPWMFSDYDLHVGLIDEAEKYPPDYSLLTEIPRYCIVHTTRGCIRKCGFCMVPKLEKELVYINDWENRVHDKVKELLIFDNNWTAKDYDVQKQDVEKIRQIKPNFIDFNQALDCRLMTNKIADLFNEIKIKPVRFAFDGMHEDGHIHRAIELMAKRGHRDITVLMLYNYKDTPEEYYYRAKELIKLSEELTDDKPLRVSAFPMKYTPILPSQDEPLMDIVDRKYRGNKWSEIELSGVRKMASGISMFGMISPYGGRKYGYNPMKVFEGIYGENSNEFIDRINNKKIHHEVKEFQVKQRKDRLNYKNSIG